jgi:hypothetical protein
LNYSCSVILIKCSKLPLVQMEEKLRCRWLGGKIVDACGLHTNLSPCHLCLLCSILSCVLNNKGQQIVASKTWTEPTIKIPIKSTEPWDVRDCSVATLWICNASQKNVVQPFKTIFRSLHILACKVAILVLKRLLNVKGRWFAYTLPTNHVQRCLVKLRFDAIIYHFLCFPGVFLAALASQASRFVTN